MTVDGVSGEAILVSVVIPSYGRPEMLAEAIASALAQTYPHIEVVVCDDNIPGSEEHRATEYLVRSLGDDRLTYIKTPENLGGAGARNYAVERSHGRYVAFLDDDDRWEPEKIAAQIDVFRRSSEPFGLVYTGLRVEDGNGGVLKDRPAVVTGWIRDELAETNVVGTTSSAMVPRDVFDEVGGFDSSFPARQDLDLWFRIAERYRVAAVDRLLTVNVRHREQRITLNPRRKLRARELFHRKYRSYFRAHRAIDARYLFINGRSCGKHGLRSRARWYFLRSFLRRPSRKAVVALIRGGAG